jgi:adenylate cyclase
LRLMPAKWKKNLVRYGARWVLGLALTTLALLHVLAVTTYDSVDRLDTFIADMRMRIEPPVLDERIVIVDIDENSLTEIGRWPWSRDVIANLVNALTENYKAAAIGFDVVFAEPDTSSGYGVLAGLAERELKDVPGFRGQLDGLKASLDYDGLLAEALRGKPVVLGYNVSAKQTKGLLPKPSFTVEDLNGRTMDAVTSRGYEANLDRLQSAARGGGIFTALTDLDGTLRSSSLLLRIGKAYYPSLSLATAAVYFDAKAITPYFEGTADTLTQGELAYGGHDLITIAKGNGKLTLIPAGHRLTTTIQYRGRGGPGGGAFTYVSAFDVLLGKVDKKVLDGRIVLIGTTAPGLNDIRSTPVSNEYPGVEVHANLIKSILDNRFKHTPDYAFAVDLLQVFAVGVVLSFALAVLSPLRAILLTLGAGAAVAGFNYWIYMQHDTVINMAMMLVLIALLFILNVAYGYFFEVRKSNAIVQRFGEYVTPELVAEMAEEPDKYNMDGESRELTVMFVDVRGFTTISEGMSPKALREFINLYLTAMSEDIRDSHRGTLDKYIGDAVMAFWGAPVAYPDHASRAVATSLLMQASAVRLNADFQARGWPELKIGIGLNSGLMHVGDMGSKIRKAYTVMGDAVNLASRLEGITKVYGVGIAVGEVTRRAARDYTYRELDLVRVKGKNEPVAIFEPLGLTAHMTPAALAAVAKWQAVLKLVRAQQWDGAEAMIMQLQETEPGSALYRLYRERIVHYRGDPPGPDWDGVTTYDTK